LYTYISYPTFGTRILTKRHGKYNRGSFFTYDFPSGAGNMEGDPPLMTGWKVISLLSHAVICACCSKAASMHPTRGQRGTSKMIYGLAWT
jgi:hypothetical protein